MSLLVPPCYFCAAALVNSFHIVRKSIISLNVSYNIRYVNIPMFTSCNPRSRLNYVRNGVAVEPTFSNLKDAVDFSFGETFLPTRRNDAISPDLVSNISAEPELYCELYAGEKTWINHTNSVRGRNQYACKSGKIVPSIEVIRQI